MSGSVSRPVQPFKVDWDWNPEDGDVVFEDQDEASNEDEEQAAGQDIDGHINIGR